jgi:hypothetical protein
MTLDEIKVLEKEVSKARFILSQKASELHDLIEDRLPVSFEEIPILSQATYDACKHWDELNKKLQENKKNLQ